MKCNNLDVGAMITRYEFGMLNDDERAQFERHLQACEFCAADLHGFAPVVKAMQDHREEFLQILAPKPGVFSRVAIAAQTAWDSFLSGVEGLVEVIPMPVRVLVPAVAVIVLLLVVLAPERQYSPLAQFERYEAPPVLMEEMSAADKLFYQAMVFYNRNEDSTAIVLLQRSIALNPGNAATHFYLGVSFVQQGRLDSAIVHFKTAIALPGTEGETISRWYLGNAYLRQNKGDLAAVEFEMVAAAKEQFAAEAEEALQNINRIQALPWWKRYFQKSSQE